MRRFVASLGLTTVLIASAAAPSQAEAATGTWDRAWYNGVICTTASSCLAGTAGGTGGGMSAPRGVATDAAGNVYVAEQVGNRISKFDSLGNFERAWGKNVNGGGVFGVCTVAASCLAGTAGGLGGEMNNPTGVATDAAGNVYVADFNNERIQKFNSSGTWERAWGTSVNGADGVDAVLEVCTVALNCLTGGHPMTGQSFVIPKDLATDSAGKLYAISGDAIVKFTSLGGFERTWGRGVGGSGIGGGFAVFEICATSATACFNGQEGGLGGEMNSPNGLATDADDNVYLADYDNNRIQKFDSAGNFLRAWGKDVDGVAVGTDFELCTVAASCQAGTSGGLGGEMFAPYGVDTDTAGNVYVAEQGNQRIQRFDSSGAWDRAWGRSVNGGGVFGVCTVAASCLAGTTGPKGGEMLFPSGVGTDTAGNLYVADSGNHRIQKFGGEEVVPPPPPPPGTPPPPPGTSPTVPTGKRAAALKKCKKKKKKARNACKKKAKKLPL